MRFFTLVMITACISLCSLPAFSQKLVILGSSTSACIGVDATSTCYVGAVRNYYNKSLPADTIVTNELAASGFTVYRAMPTGYVSPYSDPNFQVDQGHNINAAIGLSPSVILVNFPTNGYNIIPIDRIMFCLRTIRNYAVANHVPCFVTTSQPRTDNDFNTPAIKKRLAEVKDSVLLEFGAFAIDFYSGMFDPADSSILPAYRYKPDGVNPDFIHFNEAGHAVLAQRVIAKSIFNATLPATFLNYNAVYQDKANVISWTTAKEIEVASYEIQRSGDGISFSKAGSVIANNRSVNNQYQFTDRQPLQGWNYYKILTVDKDGRKQSTPVIKVFVNTGKLAIKRLIPQPSQVIIELQSNEAQTAELQLVNTTGAVIHTESKRISSGDITIPVNTLSLARGVYYLRLITASQRSITTSFIKN